MQHWCIVLQILELDLQLITKGDKSRHIRSLALQQKRCLHANCTAVHHHSVQNDHSRDPRPSSDRLFGRLHLQIELMQLLRLLSQLLFQMTQLQPIRLSIEAELLRFGHSGARVGRSRPVGVRLRLPSESAERPIDGVSHRLVVCSAACVAEHTSPDARESL